MSMKCDYAKYCFLICYREGSGALHMFKWLSSKFLDNPLFFRIYLNFMGPGKLTWLFSA
jgi:hypothetical protein